MSGKKQGKGGKRVESLTHGKARRVNLPTAELQSLAEQQEEGQPHPPLRLSRQRPLAEGEERERDADLDPQIVWNGVRITLTREQAAQLAETGEVEIGDAQLTWRGKDRQDWSDLVVNQPMLFVQEKVHPKAIIDDLQRQSAAAREAESDTPDLFADFNGLEDPEARAEFYQHAQHWQNRMILGDSLQVMASLAGREALRGKVQCIYFDPPYGIKFNSNWQVSTLSHDVKDGKAGDVTREPEQVKAFRDTWKDGIHSYLTYLRDRLTVARELLSESGSIFVQIGDENVHRVRAVMDEILGDENFISEIVLKTTSGAGSPTGGTTTLAAVHDFVLWYARSKPSIKYRQLYFDKADMQTADIYRRILLPTGADRAATPDELSGTRALPSNAVLFRPDNLTSQSSPESALFKVPFKGRNIPPGKGGWKTNKLGMSRLVSANRLYLARKKSIQYVRTWNDFNVAPINDVWTDVGTGSFTNEKIYTVQTNQKITQRCILMTTDPGDLVLDPTCGSGTTATVAEQWGRRWITIDTSRVALALARTRLMSARYPYYLLADSPEGRAKEAEVTGRPQPDGPTQRDLRQGFVYERVPHITLKSIANNAEIDVIWETWQRTLEPLREALNRRLGRNEPWEEWQIPRDPGEPWPEAAAKAHATAADENESDRKRKAALGKLNKALGRNYSLDDLPPAPVDPWNDAEAEKIHGQWWEARIARQREIDASIARAADTEYLYDRPYVDTSRVRVAGPFTVESLSPHRVVTARDDSLGPEIAAAEGDFQRAPGNVPETDFAIMVLENLRRAGVQQKDKADAIRFSSLEPWPGEMVAAEGRFDLLIACAFAYDAHASELSRLGPLAIVKARMNPDLHMAGELKNTGKGNLFVVFGEPDIDILEEADGEIRVKVKGIDVFDPATGEIRSDDTGGIACWFVDTAYDEESFFVRQAYFLGDNDPYKALKTALKAEIDEEAWASLYSDTSRPFPRPDTGRIAVKVINHFGDEVLKVFGV